MNTQTKAESLGYPLPAGVLAILKQREDDMRALILALKTIAPNKSSHHMPQCDCFMCDAVDLWKRVESGL